MFCTDIPAPIYLIFSNSVPPLLYYSHIPVLFISLLIGFFIFIKSKTLLSRILFVISILFSIWNIFSLITWTNINSQVISYVWSFFGVLTALLFISCIYFVHVYVTKKDVNLFIKSIWLIILLPLVIFIKYAATGFDLSYCEVTENFNYVFYIYLTGFISFVWILVFSIYHYFKTKEIDLKKQIIYLTLGISAFLVSFFVTGFLASYLDNFNLEQYGLFGMVIFIAYLAFLIVKFHAFDIKLIATQALVWGVIILIGSQFFFIQSNVNMVLNSITLVISSALGLIIIRSVKKEIAQKEEIEKTAIELGKANEKLKAFDVLKSKFLSLASHQLRNPVSTMIAGTSMFLDGDFGEISELQRDQLTQMYKRAQDMNDDVEKYLTVAKIDQGGLQYTLKSMDLAELTRNITESQKIIATKKGLTLSFETDGQLAYLINGDEIQLKQVVQNLIDNAMKFTVKGWIKVKLSNDKKRGIIKLSVSDSGRGITAEILPTLFKEFSRGDAAKVDVGGSGIGIYLAKEIVEKGHNGKIWVESDGADRGATFIVELPAELSK